MKRLFLYTLLCLFTMIEMNAQDVRFGFQISPSYSWLLSNDKEITAEGGNFGLKLAVLGEYYFRDNYAITGGLGFAFNSGGTLQHKQGGDFLSKSELSDAKFHDLSDGVMIDYNIQFVELPIGLKMRSNEFGYMRYFAEIPIFTLGFKTQARGDITNNLSGNTEKENIGPDVNFLNLSWGLGAGAEYNVNDNTTIVMGLYYQHGFFDITDDDAQKITKDNMGVEISRTAEDSKGTIGSLTLRVGVIF